MAKSHHDKVAVISGAASGIGQAFAERLAHDDETRARLELRCVLPKLGKLTCRRGYSTFWTLRYPGELRWDLSTAAVC